MATIERFDGRTNTLAWKSEEYEPYGWIHPTGSMDSAESEDKPDGQPRQEDKGYKEYKDYKVFKAENTLYNVLEPYVRLQIPWVVTTSTSVALSS